MVHSATQPQGQLCQKIQELTQESFFCTLTFLSECDISCPVDINVLDSISLLKICVFHFAEQKHFYYCYGTIKDF